MIEGREVVERLAAERAAGASRDELLRRAVAILEGADERYDWVGVYLLEGADGGPSGGPSHRETGATPDLGRSDDAVPGGGEELVLHNYIGRETDHTRIPVGTGVCGTAVAEGRDINVPDVDARENYLACSVETKSELVVLIRDPRTGRIHGQLDLDSDTRAAFTEEDERELRVVADWLAGLFD